MSKKIQNNCKLCNRKKELRDSHIIPKLFYRKLKTNENFYHVISTDENKNIYTDQREFTEYLLCETCEDKFQKHESYICNALYNFPKYSSKKGNKVVLYNIDYNKFKLFQLSVLWRSSITTRFFFENVSLAPKHEDKIKSMLQNSDPGEEHEYCCSMLAMLMEGKIASNLIMSPNFYKKDNHNIFALIFGGFKWHYIVSSHMHQIPKELISIRKDNTLHFRLKKMEEDQDIIEAAKAMSLKSKT